MSYHDEYYYAVMPIPRNLTLEYIVSLRKRVDNIDFDVSSVISELIQVNLDKINLEDYSLSEEDLFKLSENDEKELKTKMAVREHLNNAINKLLIPALADPLSYSYKRSGQDFSFLNIKDDVYIVTGGPKKYTCSPPTDAYNYIISLNIFGLE